MNSFVHQRQVEADQKMTMKELMLQRKKRIMMTTISSKLRIISHQVLSKAVLPIFGRVLFLRIAKNSMHLNLKMISTLWLDMLALVTPTLSVVISCPIPSKKRREWVYGRWLKIILEKTSLKCAFLSISTNLSLLCKNVLKIWNILIFLTGHMNGGRG